MKPTGIALKDVIEAGLRAVPYEAWHDETTKERWSWHASSLSNCPRQMILKRAGLANDGRPFDGQLVLRLGTILHSEIERDIQAWVAEDLVNRSVVVQEVGYYHKTLNLAAKPDAVIRNGELVVLSDYKSEHEFAVKRRREDAKAAGRTTAAKYEHMIQLTATAMVLESNDIVADEGRIWYLSKSAMWPDEQPVDIHDPNLRREVERLVHRLDAAWETWTTKGILPPPLPNMDTHWMCRAVSSSNNKGKYCEARSTCVQLQRMGG